MALNDPAPPRHETWADGPERAADGSWFSLLLHRPDDARHKPMNSFAPVHPITRARVYFPHLDALRTCAFMAVFLRHTFRYEVESFQGPDLVRRFLAVITNGAYGVSLFFVLSGFLITYLLLEETAAKGHIDIRAFYMRRILRIWPLYYGVLLIGFVLYPATRYALGLTSSFAHEWPWYAGFLSNFDVMNAHHRGLGGSTLMMVAITWSVAIEEQFYLVWPWVVRWTSVFRRSAFLSIVGASLLFRSFYADDHATLHFHTFAAVGDLALGAFAADIAFSNASTLRRLLAFGRGWLSVLAYALALILLMYQESWLGPGLGRLVQGACFTYLIIEQCYGADERMKLSRLLPLTTLGRYTYGLYLLHPVAITVVDIASRRLMPGLSSTTSAWLLFALALPLSLALAMVSYRVLEKPFLDLKQRFAS